MSYVSNQREATIAKFRKEGYNEEEISIILEEIDILKNKILADVLSKQAIMLSKQ